MISSLKHVRWLFCPQEEGVPGGGGNGQSARNVYLYPNLVGAPWKYLPDLTSNVREGNILPLSYPLLYTVCYSPSVLLHSKKK